MNDFARRFAIVEFQIKEAVKVFNPMWQGIEWDGTEEGAIRFKKEMNKKVHELGKEYLISSEENDFRIKYPLLSAQRMGDPELLTDPAKRERVFKELYIIHSTLSTKNDHLTTANDRFIAFLKLTVVGQKIEKDEADAFSATYLPLARDCLSEMLLVIDDFGLETKLWVDSFDTKYIKTTTNPRLRELTPSEVQYFNSGWFEMVYEYYCWSKYARLFFNYVERPDLYENDVISVLTTFRMDGVSRRLEGEGLKYFRKLFTDIETNRRYTVDDITRDIFTLTIEGVNMAPKNGMALLFHFEKRYSVDAERFNQMDIFTQSTFFALFQLFNYRSHPSKLEAFNKIILNLKTFEENVDLQGIEREIRFRGAAFRRTLAERAFIRQEQIRIKQEKIQREEENMREMHRRKAEFARLEADLAAIYNPPIPERKKVNVPSTLNFNFLGGPRGPPAPMQQKYKGVSPIIQQIIDDALKEEEEIKKRKEATPPGQAMVVSSAPAPGSVKKLNPSAMAKFTTPTPFPQKQQPTPGKVQYNPAVANSISPTLNTQPII